MFGRAAPRVRDSALRALAAADYPANVRDLRNLVIRILITSGGAEELTEAAVLECCDQPPQSQEAGEGAYRALRDVAERKIIEEALARSGGNKRRTAEHLHLTEQGLYKAMKRLGLREGS